MSVFSVGVHIFVNFPLLNLNKTFTINVDKHIAFKMYETLGFFFTCTVDNFKFEEHFFVNLGKKREYRYAN